MTRQSLALGDSHLVYNSVTTGHDGQAVPVLLLHPWFGCCAFWDSTQAALAAPSYAVDWYSLAEGDADAWSSPEALSRAALGLLDDLELPRVDVVGNSVGGIVAQLLAARHPERVRRLVLVGTGASLGGPPTAFGALVSAWIDGGADDRAVLAGRLVDALVHRPLRGAERERYVRAVREADPEFISHVLSAARRLDLRPELGRILAPTLVIRGEFDAARSRDHVADLVALVPDARAVEMRGCGHSPMVEDPFLFHELVSRHLA